MSVSQSVPGNLGPYRLLNMVHNGHNAQVWRAYNDAKQGQFAVKLLQERFRKDREHLAYLKHEQAVAAEVAHPRVIAVQDVRLDHAWPFLAMEWFPHPSLKVRIRQGIGSLTPVIPRIVVECAEAVAYFNSKGWIHRDVKPDNFLVTDDGDVKLIDFALAQRKRGMLGRLFSLRSKIQGTRSYMSPEQIRGESLDERSDMYSLACTLFELVAGKPPFTGVNSDELLNKHLKVAPPFVEAANANVTPEFSQLLRGAMAKDRAARPKSSQEFFERLRDVKVFRRSATSAG